MLYEHLTKKKTRRLCGRCGQQRKRGRQHDIGIARQCVVTGNVYSSTITATGSISTGGTVINSKLYSGYFGVMFNRIYNTSKLLLEELLVLQKAVRILMQTVEKRRQAVKYGQAVLLIIERKARKLPRLVRELHRLLLLIKPSFHQNLDQLLHFLSVFANQGKMVESGLWEASGGHCPT